MNFDETIEDLRTAWELSGHRSGEAVPPQNRDPSLLDYKRVGLFSEQIARYLELFDDSQIMVTCMEDWIRDPRSLYIRLMHFLQVEDDGRTDFPQIHAAKHVSSRAVHRLTQRPPGLLKTAARLVRRLPGMGDVKPVRLLRKLNTRKGYVSGTVDVDLAREIDAYFAEDQRRVRQIMRALS